MLKAKDAEIRFGWVFFHFSAAKKKKIDIVPKQNLKSEFSRFFVFLVGEIFVFFFFLFFTRIFEKFL